MTVKQRIRVHAALAADPYIETYVVVRSVEVIDRDGIRAAHVSALKEAREAFPGVNEVIIDGNLVLPFGKSVIKADDTYPAVSAAAVIAKQCRDAMMIALDLDYPFYEFRQHKGYPTPAHLRALKRHGPMSEHRRSFGPVKELLQ